MGDAAKIVDCRSCRFWAAGEGIERLCRRHAPLAGERSFEVGRWSETRATDACGEGEVGPQDRDHDPTSPKQCDACIYWHRPGVGIDPGNRGDHFRAWWERAGYCRRFAPRPSGAIGDRAFWRATHATDYCFDGTPIPSDQRP